MPASPSKSLTPAAVKSTRDPEPAAVSRPELAVVLALTLLVHGRAVRGGFQLDDFFHLYEGRTLSLTTYLLQQENGHFMPVLKAMCLALYGVFGVNASLFLLVALAVHLLNVA